MSNRTNRIITESRPFQLDGLDDLVRGAVERVVEARLAALAAAVASVEGRLALADQRIAALDQRVAALSLPDQLAVLGQVKGAIESQLREGVRQLEWFAAMAAKVRELYADASDVATPMSDGLPTVSDISVALAGGKPAQASSGLEGVPPEVASMLGQLFGPKK